MTAFALPSPIAGKQKDDNSDKWQCQILRLRITNENTTRRQKINAVCGSYEKTDYDFTIYIDYIIYLYII